MFQHRHKHRDIEGLKPIFQNVNNPFEFNELEKRAKHFLFTEEKLLTQKIEFLYIYATGLTSALMAVLNAIKCSGLKVKVVILHYNKETDEYEHQRVYL